MVKQYTCLVKYDGTIGMVVRDNGAFVLTEDYEPLDARVKELEAALRKIAEGNPETDITSLDRWVRRTMNEAFDALNSTVKS